jgi:D-alanyl-D-alanine carboxypeptidase
MPQSGAFALFAVIVLTAVLLPSPRRVHPSLSLFRAMLFSRDGRRAVTFCLLLSLSLLSFAQQAQSTGPPVQQLKRWIAAYDNSDWDAYSEFLKTNFAPRAENIFQDRSVRRQTGAFDLIKIEKETPTEVIALLNGRDSDRVGRIVVEVEAIEPHRILKLEARAIPRPLDLPLPHLNESELIASLRQRLNETVSADTFSGAVLLANNGQPIFAQAYGLADREHHIPNSLNTRFRIGSMNKMFTAVATLQLVSTGKLKLDDPVIKYLPDYPNRELASKVTINQLLSHTGGTGDFFGPQFSGRRLEFRTHEDYIKLLGSRPVRFEPGSRFEYSNYGFIILGAVIEKVSGQSYYNYVRGHLYSPASMTSTGSEPEGQVVPDLSVGYTKQGGDNWQRNTFLLPYRGTSAGGGYSTLGDLLRFADALRSNKLLDAYYTKLLTAGKIDMPFGGRYAYGFEDRTMNGSHCLGHGGGSPGMNGELDICQDSTYTVAVLANMDPEAAGHIAEFIVNRLPAPNVKP